MKVASKISFILLGIVIGTVLIMFISSTNQGTIASDSTDDITEEKVDTSNGNFIQDNYKIYNIPLPEDINFAGEFFPINNIDVAERLDREIMVNTFWHSQTFLLIKRAHRWFPLIEPILKENNIPDDFKYLAVIESGLDNVTSPAGAKGIWQFMKTTATGYNLEVNENIDERYHLEKSTEAACKYLNSAYQIFNDWTLAAASYNMGKSGLKNKLNKQQTNSYYDLLLNIETGRYVYRIIAAKHILSSPKMHGFNILEEDLYEPYETKTVQVDTAINDLTQFSIQNNTNYKTLKLLNPWLRSNILPDNETKIYSISLPAESAQLDPISVSIHE